MFGFSRSTRNVAAASFAAAILTLGVAASAQTVPAGTEIHTVLLSNDLNTKSTEIGQRFTMEVVSPYPNGDARFANARVYGHVASVRAAGQGKKPELGLAFDQVRLTNGRSAPVVASVVKMQTVQDNTTARKALGAGVGAAVGSQTIGRLLGGTAGSVVGILGGAAGGYAYGANNKANVTVPHGATVTMQLTNDLVETRRQSRY